MSPPRTLIDVNATVGPWPHGDCETLDVAGLLARLDALGIERALVHHSVAATYDAATGNARLLEELRGSDRLLPCFVVGPLETGEFGDPSTFAARLVSDGVHATRAFPAAHSWSLGGAEAHLLARMLGESGLPLFVDLPQTTLEDVGRVASLVPSLPLVLCRVGYRDLRRLLPLLARHPQLSCDLSYFAAHDGVEEVVDRFGAERLLFGTGMPVCEPAGALARLTYADLNEDDVEAIGHRNAERLLRLDARAAVPAEPPDETLAAAEASAGRLYCYLVAAPHRPQDEDALEAALARPCVVGLKIHPDTHTCPADDARYGWVFRLAERTGSPVLAHTFAGTPWSDPLRFDAVAAAFPSVPIVLAHAGVTPDGFRRAIEVCRRHDRLVVDTCGSYMTGDWIRRLVDGIAAERVLDGSDAPFIDLRYGLGRVLGAGLPERELDLVLSGNARRLLGVPRPISTTPTV